MEIPTYPYDQEYITRSMKLSLAVDRCFRHSLAKILDGIVTFSNAGRIFGGKTIRISNGIDFDAIPLKQNRNNTSHELHLIGVAEVHYGMGSTDWLTDWPNTTGQIRITKSIFTS